MNGPSQLDDQMLYVSFNQDSSCFALGTERGFKIYNSFPFKDNFERVLEGGIGIVEMYYRSNIIALVGGGKNPKYNKNKVIIWDDYQAKVISELKFTSSIKNVKMKKDKIIVVCEKRIFVFNLITYENIDILDTAENPKGLVAVNTDSSTTVIAFPIMTDQSDSKGFIKLKHIEKGNEIVIHAHDGSVSYMAMNREGTLIATASDKGTIIRIYRCIDGVFLQEFRRGKEKAEISYICFDAASKLMAATSDRGTIHIWSMGSCIKTMNEKPIQKDSSLVDNRITGRSEIDSRDSNTTDVTVNEGNKKEKVEDFPKNQSSIFKGLPGIGTFFKSEWSFAKLRIDNQKSICAFGEDNTIIAITSEGKYYQATIDLKKGGDCVITKEASLNGTNKK